MGKCKLKHINLHFALAHVEEAKILNEIQHSTSYQWFHIFDSTKENPERSKEQSNNYLKRKGTGLWGTRVAATPFWRRISQPSAAAIEGMLTWAVKRRFRWIRNPVPEIPLAVADILAIAGPLPVKRAAFNFSDLPTPLQKHHDSLKTPILSKSLF